MRQHFYKNLSDEVARIDAARTTKRYEKVIEGYTGTPSPSALIGGQKVQIFNSNDYLGLRLHPVLRTAEQQASETYGTGPGAVRFIAGTLKVHRDLETSLAKFHGREAAMIFSSAFAVNMAVLFSLIKGQNKDSLLTSSALVISDELNHRSIIDGIRLANLDSTQKAIFKHLDSEYLREVLESNVGKFDRVIVVTDGVFSMLGELQKLDKLRSVVDEFDTQFPQGVLLIVDDAHGVAAVGKTGRGVEEVTHTKADVLIGTMGKGFGADGGYVVADQVVIDYLRESAATYIYSNSISPGTAGAALAAVQLVDKPEGRQLLQKLRENILLLKKLLSEAGLTMAADSSHPVQPLLIGEAAKCKALTNALFAKNYLVTNLSYPVVTKGRDEIRIQLSATHTTEDIETFVKTLVEILKKL